MTVDEWQWAAIIALLVLQLIVLVLTQQCFDAVLGCIKAIREALSGKRPTDTRTKA